VGLLEEKSDLNGMIPPRVFYIIVLVWFFGWGFLLLKYPVQCSKVLAWGRTPTPSRLKMAKVVGYMGMFFGCLFLLEIALGIVR